MALPQARRLLQSTRARAHTWAPLEVVMACILMYLYSPAHAAAAGGCTTPSPLSICVTGKSKEKQWCHCQVAQNGCDGGMSTRADTRGVKSSPLTRNTAMRPPAATARGVLHDTTMACSRDTWGSRASKGVKGGSSLYKLRSPAVPPPCASPGGPPAQVRHSAARPPQHWRPPKAACLCWTTSR